MPRYSTYPTLYDELKTITIAALKKLGYLKSGYRKGNLRWTCRGEPTGDVDITVWLDEQQGRGILTISYIYAKERSYQIWVDMVAVPSNLGIGQRWYFICPRTGKRCIKLYMANEYFQHRDGIPGAMYHSQTRSKYYRRFDQMYNKHDQICQPYLKRHYRGKPTKRYQRACQAFQESERIGRYLLATM